MDKSDSDNGGGRKTAIYVEDAVILASIALLFVLTIFYRREMWAQILLGVVLVAMAVVLVRRVKRFNKAFRDEQDRHKL